MRRGYLLCGRLFSLLDVGQSPARPGEEAERRELSEGKPTTVFFL